MCAVLPLPLLVGWAAFSCASFPPARWDMLVRLASLSLNALLVILAARRATVARAMAAAFVAAMAVVSAVAIVQFVWGRFIWGIGRTSEPDYSYFIELAPGLVRAPGTFQSSNSLGISAAVAFLIVAFALFAHPPAPSSPARGLGRPPAGRHGVQPHPERGGSHGPGPDRPGAAGAGVATARLLLVGVAVAAALVGLLRWRGGQEEETSSQQHRLLYWKAAAQMAIDHPLTGVGLGQFGRRFQASASALPVKIAALPTHEPHNVLLQLAAETGLLGLAVFVAFVGPPPRPAARTARSPARLSAALLLPCSCTPVSTTCCSSISCGSRLPSV